MKVRLICSKEEFPLVKDQLDEECIDYEFYQIDNKTCNFIVLFEYFGKLI